MLNNKTIAVVIPAHNEESQIGMVIETMPDFVDRIVIVNDDSTDRTAKVAEEYFKKKENKSSIEIRKNNHFSKGGIFSKADKIMWEKLQSEIKFFAAAEIVNKNPYTDRIILIKLLKKFLVQDPLILTVPKIFLKMLILSLMK